MVKDVNSLLKTLDKLEGRNRERYGGVCQMTREMSEPLPGLKSGASGLSASLCESGVVPTCMQVVKLEPFIPALKDRVFWHVVITKKAVR